MFTAHLVNTTTNLENYPTLEDAILEQVRYGWEEETDLLLRSPILIADETGAFVAIVSYSPDPEHPDHPLLTVHWTHTGRFSLFRWTQFRDSYDGILVAQGGIR